MQYFCTCLALKCLYVFQVTSTITSDVHVYAPACVSMLGDCVRRYPTVHFIFFSFKSRRDCLFLFANLPSHRISPRARQRLILGPVAEIFRKISGVLSCSLPHVYPAIHLGGHPKACFPTFAQSGLWMIRSSIPYVASGRFRDLSASPSGEWSGNRVIPSLESSKGLLIRTIPCWSEAQPGIFSRMSPIPS